MTKKSLIAEKAFFTMHAKVAPVKLEVEINIMEALRWA